MSNHQREQRINVTLMCVLIMFIISLPLFTDFLLCGTKLSYQLIRIEALKNGLEQYGLHLWSKPEWIHPMGYMLSMHYGDTFLYIPAVLNLMGLSIQASYRIFLVLINIATVIISYKVFEKIFCDKYVGILGAALYSASIYRIFLLYGESELGESLALVFLPLVLYGYYLIFVKPSKWAYFTLAIGLGGILRSHILSFCIVLIFSLIVILIHIKQLKSLKVWIQLMLAMIVMILQNLNYLYTMFRYVTCGVYALNPFEGQTIQAKGLQIAQLFMCFYQAGGSHEFGANGVANAVPVGLGFVLLLGIVLFMYLVFVYGDEYPANAKRHGFKALFIGALACYMSVLSFPWDRLSKCGGKLAEWISAIQEPWHFLQVGLLAFSILGCIVYKMLREKNAMYSKIYGIGMVMAALLFSSYLATNMLFTYDFVRIYIPEEIPYGEVAGMGIQVELMHNWWYVFTAVSILTLVGNIIFVLKNTKKREQ